MRSVCLFACILIAAPAAARQAQSVGGYGAAPAPITVQPLPGSTDADLLAAAMRRVGANSNDLSALLDAGDLSVRVGDLSAAAAFYTRAERIDLRSGRAKAGEGAILVRAERPGEALRYFAMAESYGAPVAAFASDRGWAYDLLGENERAQRDYRFVLKARQGDADTVRRYALSLGIAGKQKLALDTLAPQIRAGDRTAWRDRAFIEAMGGDQAEAQRIATTMLPPGVSIGLLPFLRLLSSLGAADRAFAVHFGEVRATPERLADARLTPLLPALGPDPDPPQVAVAAVVVPRVERAKRPKRGRGVEVAAREPAPEPALPIPAYQGGVPGYAAQGYGAARAANAPVAVAIPATIPPVSHPTAAAVATSAAAPLSVSTQRYAARPSPLATSAIGSPPVPASAPSAPSKITPQSSATASIAIGPAPVAAALLTNALPPLAAVPITPLPAMLPPSSPPFASSDVASASTAFPAGADIAATSPLASAPTVGNYKFAPPVTAAPLASGLSVTSSAPASIMTLPAQTDSVEPVTRPFTVPLAESRAAPTSTLPPSTLLPSPLSPTPMTAAALTSYPTIPVAVAPSPPRTAPPTPSPALTQLVAALPIPGAELSVTPPPPTLAAAPDTSAADAAAAAATQAALEQAARQAAAERVAKRALAAKVLADKRAAERKVAAEKQALADKKAAAEARAEADRIAAAEKKAARANPSRIWVQVAGGASQGDLPDAWGAAKAKAPDVYTGHATGWTTPLRATNRVLAGPFKTDEEARAFVNALAKKGASGFTFTSKTGQAIAKLPKE